MSPVAIIVVALAGIAGYTLPNQELGNAVRLLRLALVLAAALAGLFGILAMLGLVIWYLCTIDSDGVAHAAAPAAAGQQVPPAGIRQRKPAAAAMRHTI